jgi:hypothetical protein
MGKEKGVAMTEKEDLLKVRNSLSVMIERLKTAIEKIERELEGLTNGE